MAEASTPRARGPAAEDITAARRKLVRVLAGIASLADERSLERCPYRTREDACTFAGGCRNQLRGGTPLRCAGGQLNPLPASELEVRRALEAME